MKVQFHKKEKVQPAVQQTQVEMRKDQNPRRPILGILIIVAITAVVAGLTYKLLRLGHVYTYGFVSAKQQELRAPFSGKISKLSVQQGDVVQKGTLLFSIDSLSSEKENKALQEFADQLATQHDVIRKKAENVQQSVEKKGQIEVQKLSELYEIKKRNYQRLQELLEMDAAVRSDVESAYNAMQLALHNLEQAKVDLASVLNNESGVSLQRAEVDLAIARSQPKSQSFFADFDAIVLQVNAAQGSGVAQQQMVVTLAHTEGFWIDAYFPPKKAKYIEEGNEVILYEEGLKKKFFGVIASQAGAVTVVKTPEMLKNKLPGEPVTIYTRINVDNSAGLLPGNIVRIIIK